MASLLKSIKQWFKTLFGKAKMQKLTILPEVTPEISVAKTPGLSCPVCGHRIIVSIENLLSGQEIQCPSCGLELSVDEDKSGGALEALNKLQNGLKQASKIRADNGI